MRPRARLRRLSLGQSAGSLPWYVYGASGGAITPGSQAERTLLPQSPAASRTNLASQSSLQAALASGSNAGVVQTLYALGATDSELQAVANGSRDPVELLNYLTGNSPAPGQPVTATSTYPQAAVPQQVWYGPLPPAAISATVTAADAAAAAASAITGGTSDALAWLGNNWPWLALGGIGVWWLSREL